MPILTSPMKHDKDIILAVVVAGMALALCGSAFSAPPSRTPSDAAKQTSAAYCKRCGQKYTDAKTLLRNRCPHGSGGQGKHVLFEGEEADKYICENCGTTYTSLKDLARNTCPHGTESLPVHSPYRGGIQAQYTCRWCGSKYTSLKDMTRNSCPKRPAGRGTHRPTGM